MYTSFTPSYISCKIATKDVLASGGKREGCRATRCHLERVRADSKSRAEMSVKLRIPIGSYFPLRIKGRGKCRPVILKVPTEGSVLPKAFADLLEYGGVFPRKIPRRKRTLEDLLRAE